MAPLQLLALASCVACVLAAPTTAPAAQTSEPWRLSLRDPAAPRLVESLRPGRGRGWRAVQAPKGLKGLKDPNPDPFRLPSSIVPTFYEITIFPKLSGDFKFHGEVTIDINALEDSNSVTLNAKELEFEQGSVTLMEDGDTSTAVSSTSIKEDKEHEMITISFGKVLKANRRYQLYFKKFIGYHNNRNEGFYRSSYKLGDEVRWLVTTQFEETGARLAFPCFDEPSFKARFQISIAREPFTYTAVSNMPIHKQDATSYEGLIVDTFEVTVPMSTYLVAFIVSDFEYLEDLTIFKTWGRKEILQGGKFAQYIGPKALELEAEWTGIPFALPKVDQFAIPDFEAGAMENWGLVTYREPYLLHTDETTSRIVEYTATTICHELGHQWTGDLVTLDWWSHTWLNEGFATYFENYICAKILPDWNLIDKYVPANTHRGMTADAEEGQIAMSSPVSSPSEYGSKFDYISYEKAGAVLRMFHNILTPEVFRAGVHRYLTINAYKNTNPTHLFEAIHEAAVSANILLPEKTTFVEVGLTWSEQPGVPVLFVQRDYASGGINLRQERFFYSTPAAEHSEAWYIPLNWVTRSTQSTVGWESAEVMEWLNPDYANMDLQVNVKSDDWLLLNPQANSYYRVAYDDENWKLLAEALAANSTIFPTATRAQLLNDALNLARAGMLDYSLALDMTRFLEYDTEVTSWMTAVNTLNFLRTQLSTTPGNSLFLEYLNKLTTKAFRQVGMTVNADSDSHENLMLRYYVTSWACYSGQQDCVGAATNLLRKWLADNSIRLHPDIRTSALCYGVRGGDWEAFHGLMMKWDAETDTTLRNSYLTALACTSDFTLLEEFMSDGLAGLLNLDAVDVQSIFKAVFNRHENHESLMQFVTSKIAEIDEYFGSSDFSTEILVNLVLDIRSRSEFTKTVDYANNNLKGWSGFERVNAALAQTEKELKWFDLYYSTVISWLAAEVPLTTPTSPTAPTIPTSPSTLQTTPDGHQEQTTTTESSGVVPLSSSLLLGLICLLVLILKNPA